jgi:hypothetical protein
MSRGASTRIKAGAGMPFSGLTDAKSTPTDGVPEWTARGRT